jgi:chromate transporter
LNLAVWFGLHVIFPVIGAVDWFAIAIAVGAFIGMTRWKWEVVPVILGAGLAGLIFKTWLLQLSR